MGLCLILSITLISSTGTSKKINTTISDAIKIRTWDHESRDSEADSQPSRLLHLRNQYWIEEVNDAFLQTSLIFQN